MPLYPVPILFSQSLGGPLAGHFFSQPVSRETWFRSGPSHSGQSSAFALESEPASATSERDSAKGPMARARPRDSDVMETFPPQEFATREAASSVRRLSFPAARHGALAHRPFAP